MCPFHQPSRHWQGLLAVPGINSTPSCLSRHKLASLLYRPAAILQARHPPSRPGCGREPLHVRTGKRRGLLFSRSRLSTKCVGGCYANGCFPPCRMGRGSRQDGLQSQGGRPAGTRSLGCTIAIPRLARSRVRKSTSPESGIPSTSNSSCQIRCQPSS